MKILQDTKPEKERPSDVAKFNTTILTWVCGGVCLAGLISIATLFTKEIGRRRKYEKLYDELDRNEKSSLVQDNQLENGTGTYGAI